jgi:phosphoribosylformylglycinamidine cyclo-ligase
MTSPPARSAVAEPLTYAAAGVDIGAGERAVDLIRPLAAATARPEVLGGLGGFGGLFAVPSGYRQPVLVATTDGVGTKLEVARQCGRFGTVGIDLVAMCVDDLVCQGAEPLFFLDYVAVGRLDPAQVASVVAGVAEGCRQAGCALLGGETAEHPGTMAVGQVDLAGFAVGVVERDEILDGSAVRPGDRLIGLASPGLRSNGFSLARAIIDRAGAGLADPAWPGASHTLGDALLEPSLIYAPSVLALQRSVPVHAVAHITGGGLAANLVRALPRGVVAVVDPSTWPVPRIQAELVELGGVEPSEAATVFNLGIGMVVVVPADAAEAAVAFLGERGLAAHVIGAIEAGSADAAGVRILA